MTPATISELYERAVLHGGARTAIVDGERRFSYAQIGAHAAQIAAALQNMGVDRTSQCATLSAKILV